MPLNLGGSTAGKVQAVQGLSKTSAVHGTSVRMNNGRPATSKTGTITAKSKKKKVIVNALLGMMQGGGLKKMAMSSGNMNRSKF